MLMSRGNIQSLRRRFSNDTDTCAETENNNQ